VGDDVRRLSAWWDGLEEVPELRPGLEGDLDVDVAIVGGGFTGLWTARSLLEADPTMRVCVLEAERCGFGASGRNGGWASALFAASDARIAAEHGIEAARRMRRAMERSIDEIAAACEADGIDCRFEKGGSLSVVRNGPQRARADAELAEARRLGVDRDLRWLDATEVRARTGMSHALGATATPHCASVDPARLAVGLAASVASRGARVAEQTRVVEIAPGTPGSKPSVRTAEGHRVRAEVVVQATEAFSVRLPGLRRRVLPVYSMMIATEPLSDEQLAEVGLADRATFADHRNMIIYGQRTADGRLAFGGRGAPYHFGSRIAPRYDRDASVARALEATLTELFPSLADAAITHHWGGPLGIPRDWHSGVGLDRRRGLAYAGGYVGDGVTTSNLAGRTLAQLISGQLGEEAALPWVGHESRPWEPEPLRWLGVNAGLVAAKHADRVEERTGRASRASGLLGTLLSG
jgi:glycine/D-amino acid oxidase-like deaminating enzyme